MRNVSVQMSSLDCDTATDRQTATRGYSLIETAIVVLVLALIMASFVSAYRIYMRAEQQTTTVANIGVVTQQLASFLIQKGRYPCPARLDASRDPTKPSFADYGNETQCEPVVADQDISITLPYPGNAVGTCANGICLEESQNMIGGVYLRVRRGAVPFRALGLREEASMDGYGNRLQYVVTELLAGNPAKFDKDKGAISLLDGQGRFIQYKEDGLTELPLHDIVFSSGPDRVGAYSYYGIAMRPCTGPVITYDMENCNTSAVNKKAIYRLTDWADQYDLSNAARAAKHFDDYVQFNDIQDIPLWRIADKDAYHIRDLVDSGTATGGKVGINETALQDLSGPVSSALPSPTYTAAQQAAQLALTQARMQAEVSGDLKASQSNVNNKICDTLGMNCFTPAEIAKNNSLAYNCTGTDTVTGVHNDAVDCGLQPGVMCPAGSILQGIKAGGALNCVAVVGCTPLITGLCSPDVWSIPAGVQNQPLTSPLSGVSYRETWKCMSNGSWQKTGSSGICTCNAADTTYTQDCNSYKGYGNWTGVVNWRYQHTCPANTDTYTKLSDNCTCANTSYNTADSCGSGYSGSITYKQDWVCSSPTAGALGARTETGRTCACIAQADEVTTGSCQAYYTGSIKTKRVWTCTSGTTGSWGPSIPVSNTCTCAAGTTQTQTIGCVAPAVGTRQQSSTYDCATSTWGPWVTYADNCGAVVYSWHAKSGVTGNGSTPLARSVGNSCSPVGTTSGCSEPAGAGTYNYYALCQCE